MDSLSKEINLIVVSSLFLLIVAVGIIILVLIYQKKQLQFIREKEQFKFVLEREIAKAQLEIQEQTLKNVSLEIHDNMNQRLALARLNLASVATVSLQSDEEKISDAKEIVSNVIIDLRDLSKSMNADAILSEGLLKALEREIKLINKSGRFQAALKIKGEPADINSDKELILFRIVQEAINNIIKHSGADEILITAEFEHQFLKLIIKDNGNGFQKDEGAMKGSGLRNMKIRAELIGGKLEVETSAQGTILQVTTPV